MKYNLRGQKIALLGGDGREIKLLDSLLKQGANLEIIGEVSDLKNNRLNSVSSLKELAKDLDAVIAPMTGTDENYQLKKTFGDKEVILSEEFFARLNEGTKFFIGFAKPKLKRWSKKYQIDLIELAALDELAILNAIPTAEGAIEIAIRESSITLHGNNSFVLGLGRVGLSLARMLAGLGTNVFGVARKPKDLARAFEMGLNAVSFNELAQRIEQADFIFNTVPVEVLDRKVLENVKSQALIIDLASAPGGTDFEVAKELGIDAQLALGLPGKVAPESAGDILANIIPRIILSGQ